MKDFIKSIAVGFSVLACVIAGYQLRKYETRDMVDMFRKIQEHDKELLRKEQQVSAECLDELDRCREEGCD